VIISHARITPSRDVVLSRNIHPPDGVQGTSVVAEPEAEWRSWMVAARKGDEGAYRKLLAALAPRLRALARAGLARAGRPTADAEDIVQETLIALHVNRHTWDESQPLSPWVRSIARHKVIDALRRRGSYGQVAIDDIVETLAAEEPDEGVPTRDVLRLAATLPQGQRTVVESIVVEGLTTRETADKLDMSEGAVRVSLHRGLKALGAAFRAAEDITTREPARQRAGTGP
jgi:RNA polymerase sigma-70 factor (ECF subfamily)